MSQITKESFENFVKNEFPGKEYRWEYKDGRGYMYIQAGTGKRFSGDEVHYEFYDGQVRMHIEGPHWWTLRERLLPILSKHKELQGAVWQKRQNCQWILISDEDDIFSKFKRIKDIVEADILSYETGASLSSKCQEEDNVVFETMAINDIYKKRLRIPEYQRIYVWKKEQVKTLLDDIVSIKEGIPYHIGAVILHEHKEEENCEMVGDIVDGQQRLVTLALIKYALTKKKVDFLENKYSSDEALLNIKNNYNYILQYIDGDNNKKKAVEDNIESLICSVLTIKNTGNLDLAFTFFSNTNSRGKKLTDYDLLKPHHLRYIPSDFEEQQMHLAKRWDSMISSKRELEKEHRKDIDYVRVMEFCLYRLRKWSMFWNEDLSVDHYIKREFEAAPIIEEIPPFGERFNFNEPIQGGQHFFAYVDYFLEKYDNFKQKSVLNEHFGREGSSSWYGNVVEALTFCYYIRFGNSYINEALLSILRYIAIIRFSKGRAYEPTILEWAKNSKITNLIEQASSPTFFLAAIEQRIEYQKEKQKEEALIGIRKTFYIACKTICEQLNSLTTVKEYNDYFNTRYGNISIDTTKDSK